jgi:ankyrin repeat protein
MDLFEAIRQGHQDEVSRVLDADPNSLETQNHVDGQEDRYRPLAWASFNGRVGMVRLLIQKGANIHATGDLGRTALFCAAQNGHKEIVALLLRQGARADIRGDTYSSLPIMVAASGGHLAVVELLLQHVGKEVLEEGDASNRTVLDYASSGGHETVVEFLLSQGASTDIGDGPGETPVMSAAWVGHLGVVKRLVDHTEGQGLEKKNIQGRTALHMAAYGGHEEVATYLLSRRAQTDVKDREGMTPLMEAIDGGHVGVVKILLQHMEAQLLDVTDLYGRTALYIAALRGHEEIVRALLLAGADATITDHGGRTPRAIAYVRGCQGCVEVLKVSIQQRILAMHSMPIDLPITLPLASRG